MLLLLFYNTYNYFRLRCWCCCCLFLPACLSRDVVKKENLCKKKENVNKKMMTSDHPPPFTGASALIFVFFNRRDYFLSIFLQQHFLVCTSAWSSQENYSIKINKNKDLARPGAMLWKSPMNLKTESETCYPCLFQEKWRFVDRL